MKVDIIPTAGTSDNFEVRERDGAPTRSLRRFLV